MSDIITHSELQKLGISAEELLKKFTDQLQKDFDMSNVHIQLPKPESLSYESIHASLSQSLRKLMDTGYSNYASLLYRIDISELQFEEALKTKKGVKSNEVLAEMILKRVLQKVVLKQVYSNETNRKV